LVVEKKAREQHLSLLACDTAAALLISFLLFACSKPLTEPKVDELMLTPIEDLGFSHDVEQGNDDYMSKGHIRLSIRT